MAPAETPAEKCEALGHTCEMEIMPGHWECKDCGAEWFAEDEED